MHSNSRSPHPLREDRLTGCSLVGLRLSDDAEVAGDLEPGDQGELRLGGTGHLMHPHLQALHPELQPLEGQGGGRGGGGAEVKVKG